MAALTIDLSRGAPDGAAAPDLRARPASPVRPTARTGDLPRWARLEGSPGRGGAPTTARQRRARQAVLRRRRLVAAIAVATLAFVAGVLLSLALMSVPAGGSLTDEARRAQQVTYVVQPGDNLWRAASHLAPDEDPRVVVDTLTEARGGTAVLPGEVLAWPAY